MRTRPRVLATAAFTLAGLVCSSFAWGERGTVPKHSAGVPDFAAHRSGCHARHTCPSDRHTYVWYDGAGQGWNCAKEPLDLDYSTARGGTTISYQESRYVGTYLCRLVRRGKTPPEKGLTLLAGQWWEYIPVSAARLMVRTVDRHAMPVSGLEVVYLPGWMPPRYRFTGWRRWLTAEGNKAVPDVSLVIYFAHRGGDPEEIPGWDVGRLDPQLGGCGGNYSYLPRQIRRGNRIIRYGNVGYGGGVFKGAVVVCFPDSSFASFYDNMPVPEGVLKRIGTSVMRVTSPRH